MSGTPEEPISVTEEDIRAQIAILEKEAEEKKIAAENAIEAAKKVLTEASDLVEEKALKATNSAMDAIAQIIAIADNEIPEDGSDTVAVEVVAVAPNALMDQTEDEEEDGVEQAEQAPQETPSEEPTPQLTIEPSLSMLSTSPNDHKERANASIESTLDVLVTKIEECNQTLSDPDATVEMQTHAAKLMAQYAKTASALKQCIM